MGALFALASSLFVGPLASAGDRASFEVIGFSKDGRYLAFEQYGVSDGSGAPYAEVILVDVSKNAFAEPPIAASALEASGASAQTASTAAALRARLRPEVDRRLSARGIVRGSLGEAVEISTTQEAPGRKRATFRSGAASYELELVTRKLPDKSCLSESATGFELKLRSAATKKTKTLERDRRALPKRRMCAIDYDFERVLLSGGRLAVFLRVAQQGFEGPNLRYMVVTGSL